MKKIENLYNILLFKQILKEQLYHFISNSNNQNNTQIIDYYSQKISELSKEIFITESKISKLLTKYALTKASIILLINRFG